MGRTKMEVDALTSKIWDITIEQQIKRQNSFTPDAKKVYNIKLKSLIQQRDILEKKIEAECAKLKIDYSSAEEILIGEIANNLAGNKPVRRSIIEREIILASDQGADALIKNISEMFL
jgi:hypothetical protein